MSKRNCLTVLSRILILAILSVSVSSCGKSSGRSKEEPPLRYFHGKAGVSVDSEVLRLTGSDTPQFDWQLIPKEE